MASLLRAAAGFMALAGLVLLVVGYFDANRLLLWIGVVLLLPAYALDRWAWYTFSSNSRKNVPTRAD